MAHLHRVLTQNELFDWIFLYLIRGWLVGASNVIGSLCNRQGTFSIDSNDNLKQIQATDCEPTY